MNANELADYLENREFRIPNHNEIKAATMLRQLQAENEALKKRELTDAEIEEAIKISTVKLSELEAYDYCYPQKYRLDEKMFARAILRKAQEK